MNTWMSLGALLGLWLADTAHAGLVTVTFCASYQVDYVDSDLPGTYDEAYEGDYFYSNSDKIARGARIRVVPSSGSSTEEYAEWDGTDAGCAGPFLMDTTQTYDVQIHSIASVRDNTIKVMNHQDTDADGDGQTDGPFVWSSTALNDWSPTSSTTVNIATANTHDAWNVAAAAGHAMWRRGGGLSNKTFDFYTEYDECNLTNEPDCDPCGNGTGSCTRSGDVHLSTEGVTKRFIIVHEMGHALEYFKRGSSSPPREYESDPDNCYNLHSDGDSHEMQSKEWQSAAIGEGWAHFYAAVAFNQTQETNCGFVYYKRQDYNLDSTDEGQDPHAISCEQGPNNLFGDPPPSPAVVDAKDYLGDWCDDPLDDRATELDWLRFWWDFMSDESTVDFDDCATILTYATLGLHGSPALGNWDPTPDSNTADEDRPYKRMEDAADFLNFTSEWSRHIDNGIDR